MYLLYYTFNQVEINKGWPQKFIPANEAEVSQAF